MITWSHSALKQFETCPRQYHEVRVLKRFPFVQSDAAKYGDEMHKAIEEYCKHKAEQVSAPFTFAQPVIDALLKKPGRKLAEYEMALTSTLRLASWWGSDVWVRGKADLLILDDDNYLAWVIDWKTGKKKYPDREQLRLMALLVFEHFPHIKQVNAGLVFLIEPHLERLVMRRSEKDACWQDYRERVARLEGAASSGVWNPNQNAFCRKFCPVVDCEFNGRRD